MWMQCIMVFKQGGLLAVIKRSYDNAANNIGDYLRREWCNYIFGNLMTQRSMDTMKQDRSNFEKWALSEALNLERCTEELSRRCNCGRYTRETTAIAYKAWIARGDL